MFSYLTYRAICFVLFCSYSILHLGVLECTAVELIVQAEAVVKIQPADSIIEPVNPFTILVCDIQPANASVRTRWITPGGQIVQYSINRYSLQLGATLSGLGSILLVHNLSYKDAGLYTCEVIERRVSVSSCDCDGFPRSSSIQLILQVGVHTEESRVTTTEGAVSVLKCEMMGYIPADEDLQWYKGEEQIYDGAGDRFFVTYEDGIPNSAQNGGNETIPSRISVLRITPSLVADAGLYTCQVKGTNASTDVTLTVLEDTTTLGDVSGFGLSTHPSQPAMTGDPTVVMPINDCKDVQSKMVAITFVCTFLVTVVASVLITVAAVCLWLKLWQHKGKLSNKSKTPPPMIVSVEQELSGKGTAAVNVQACELARAGSIESIEQTDHTA